MKRLAVIGLAFLMIGTSQASMIQNGKELSGKPIPIATPRQTATLNVRVRVSIPRVQKPKLFVGNPHKITLIADDRDDLDLEFDDVITTYRREDLQRIQTDPTDKNPEGLSEEIRWRLFLARQAALLKYREIHG